MFITWLKSFSPPVLDIFDSQSILSPVDRTTFVDGRTLTDRFLYYGVSFVVPTTSYFIEISERSGELKS